MTTPIKRTKLFGQSTVEFALLFPIVAFLLFMTFKAFKVNVGASDKAMRKHAEALTLFNHGNSGAIIIDGVPIVPERLIDPIPTRGFNPIPGLIPSFLPTGNLVNGLFSKVPFLKDDNVFTAYGKGYAGSLADQYVASGFNPGQINWRTAQLAGYVAGISSDQATKWFQGNNSDAMKLDKLPAGVQGPEQLLASSDMRELIGSGLQGGAAAAFAADNFKNGKAFFGGMAGGLLNSDSSGHWFETGSEVTKGALRGAIAGTISGLANDEKIDVGRVAIGAVEGGFYTEKVAKRFPGAAGLSDARSAASFSAVNAAVSTILKSGSKASFKDVVLNAATAGVFSAQTMKAATGSSKGAAALVKTGAVAGVYAVAASGATGGDIKAVGSSVMQSVVSSTEASAISKTRQAAWARLDGAKTPEDVNATFTTPDGSEPYVISFASEFAGEAGVEKP